MNFILITAAGLGLIYLFTGWIMLKHPPQDINWAYGYRTPRSKKSQEAWDFAQRYSSILVIRWSLIHLIPLILAFIIPEKNFVISIIIFSLWLCITPVIVFYKTEMELKIRFG